MYAISVSGFVNEQLSCALLSELGAHSSGGLDQRMPWIDFTGLSSDLRERSANHFAIF